MKVTPCCGSTEWDAYGHGYFCESCGEFFEEFADSYEDSDDESQEEDFTPLDDDDDISF